MVELRDVHMQFEEKNVLEGVSLDVQPQERLVIMGQSGSGKSYQCGQKGEQERERERHGEASGLTKPGARSHVDSS